MTSLAAPEPAAVLAAGLAHRGAWSTSGHCSMERAWRVVGERSTLLLMREAYYGTTRFDDFVQRTSISEAVTAARLRGLVTAGLLRKQPYREPGQRTRHGYSLTKMGRDLLPVVLALMQWGDRYLSDDGSGPLSLRHQECDAPIEVDVRCAEGHEVCLRDIVIEPSRGSHPHVERPSRDSRDTP